MKKATFFVLIILLTSNVQLITGQNMKRQDEVKTPDYLMDVSQGEGVQAKKVNPSVNTNPPQPQFNPKIKSLNLLIDSYPDIPLPQAENRAHIDVSVAINPNDRNNVILSTNILDWEEGQVTNTRGAAYFNSFDGGLTWNGENETMDYANYGYPAIVASSNGRHFIGYVDIGKGQSVAYTGNNGNTWVIKEVADPPYGILSLLFENHFWVDNSPDSPYLGNTYSAWHQLGGWQNCEHIVVSRSVTNGFSWSNPEGISHVAAVDGADNNMPVVATGPDGQVYVCWALEDYYENDENALGFARSLTGGLTWGDSWRIHNNIRGFLSSKTSKSINVRFSPAMVCDISDGPFRGNIYVVWANIGAPGENEGESPDIYVMKSADQGDTWGTPIRINNDPVPGGSNQIMPWASCDPVTGILCVSYYDDRNCGPDSADVYMACSYDGGESWEEFRVNDETFGIRPVPGTYNNYFAARTAIAVNDGLAVPAWQQMIGNHKPVIYCSPVELNTLPWPYFTDVNVNEETGAVNLDWEIYNGKQFSYFNIYRNGELLVTTSSTNFEDQLPVPGGYSYKITAQHSEGESASTRRMVQWGSAELSVYPYSMQITAPADTNFQRKILLSNPGKLNLEFQIKALILSDNTNLDYCIPNCDGGTNIRNVKLGNINHYSYQEGYGGFLNFTTPVKPGETDTVIMQAGNSPYEEVSAGWIDWNKNGEFEESEEMEFEYIDDWRQLYKAGFTYPDDILGGNIRVRLLIGGNEYGPCVNAYWSEYEDYILQNMICINLEEDTGSVKADSVDLYSLKFDTHGLTEGFYSLDLQFYDKLTGEKLVSTIINMVIDNDVFGPPENLVALPEGFNVALSWDPPSYGNTPLSYVIYRFGCEGFEAQTAGLFYNDENLEPGTYTYEITALYETGESMPAGPVQVEVNGMSTYNLGLETGWSGISSFIDPADPSLETLFGGNSELVILYNGDGMFRPQFNINTLVDWDVYSGYIIKLTGNEELSLTGSYPENKTINLTAGLNLIPILSTTPVNAETLFNGIAGFVMLKDVAGTDIYWPAKNINTIGDLLPGKSYFIKMSEAGTVTFD